MAAYNKINQFVQDVCSKVHNLGADALFLFLLNAAPSASDTTVDTTTGTLTIKSVSNSVEIAAGNGYSKGGSAITITTASQSGGTYTLAGNQILWTAAGGTIGPFRYICLYNNTAGSTSTRAPVAWWDYGTSLTLNNGDSFTVLFNGVNPGTIFT